MNRLHLRSAAALIALVLFGSCATTVGTLAGPVTGPVALWRDGWGVPGLAKPFLTPLAIPLGAMMGLIQGVSADVGYVRNNFEYGANRFPPFDIVFDPTSADYLSPIQTQK
jgi:hypothetical protein